MIDPGLLDELRRREFAFIDAGSGDGESTARCERRFGLGRGLGIERDGGRVAAALAAGRAAVCADALELDLPEGCVSFAAMCDFLEHLADERQVRRSIEACGRAARDFLVNFGPGGAVPVVGDWDGDGRDGLGVYVPETAEWRLRCDASEGLDDARFRFGPANSIPMRVRAPKRRS